MRLRQDREDDAGSEADLLRDLEWLAKMRARAGGRVWLGLHEMGMVGWFRVLEIGPCPELEEEGRLVTGVFRHGPALVYDLHLEGEGGPIGVTPTHLFWSVDRNCWVPAGELRRGERLLAGDGSTPQVESFTPRPEPEPVYNIEVEGDHCYRVGEQGLLVHNASTTPDFEYDKNCKLEEANQEVCPWKNIQTYHRVPNHPYYRPLEGKLPQGIRVYLRFPLPSGESPQVDPPGWDSTINIPGQTVISRGHILAKSLGGKGHERNIFTICQQTSNTPWMTEFENHIRTRIVGRKEEWYYEVELRYSSGKDIPSYIGIRGCTKERDEQGELTGRIYRTVQFWWDRGVENEAGIRGITSCTVK